MDVQRPATDTTNPLNYIISRWSGGQICQNTVRHPTYGETAVCLSRRYAARPQSIVGKIVKPPNFSIGENAFNASCYCAGRNGRNLLRDNDPYQSP